MERRREQENKKILNIELRIMKCERGDELISLGVM